MGRATFGPMTSIWTHSELIEQIRLCKEALAGGLQNKSYTIGSYTYTRNDIPQLQSYLRYLQSEFVALPENGGVRGPVFVQTVYHRGRR